MAQRKKRGIICFVVCIILFMSLSPVIQSDRVQSSGFNDSIDDERIQTLLSQVNKTVISSYLEELVSFGPRFTGTEACKQAAAFIFDEFQKLGLKTRYHTWSSYHYSSRNIEAILPSENKAENDSVILLVAHYDTIGDSPGANDDGSGIATLLTIAHVLHSYTFPHELRFVAVSGEEIGTFGSHFYARDCYHNNDTIVAVLNVDTVGYTTTAGGGTAYLLKEDRSQWIVSIIDEICTMYQQAIKLQLKPIANRGNDHQSFLEYGYDAVQFVQLERGEYPLHTPQDTIDKINYTYLTKIVKLVLLTTYRIASEDQSVQVQLMSPKEGYLYVNDIPVRRLPGFNIRGTGLRGMTYLMGKTHATINIMSDEPIASVAFCVDGQSSFSGFFQEPPYDWVIEKAVFSLFPLIGKHTLGVYVTTTSGAMAYDEMDFFCLNPQ